MNEGKSKTLRYELTEDAEDAALRHVRMVTNGSSFKRRTYAACPLRTTHYRGAP